MSLWEKIAESMISEAGAVAVVLLLLVAGMSLVIRYLLGELKGERIRVDRHVAEKHDLALAQLKTVTDMTETLRALKEAITAVMQRPI